MPSTKAVGSGPWTGVGCAVFSKIGTGPRDVTAWCGAVSMSKGDFASSSEGSGFVVGFEDLVEGMIAGMEGVFWGVPFLRVYGILYATLA